MTDNKEAIRELITVKKLINAPCRRFIVNEDVKRSYKKEYKYVQMDLRLARHANDAYGGISDCYIMYAIAKLGFADITAIQKFLTAIKKKNPNLNIMDTTDRGNLRTRLTSLFGNGFLFKSNYDIPDIVKGGVNRCSIYSIDHDSQNFMCQKLGKRVPPNKWNQAKPIEDIIAWAAASHVGTTMANNKNFVEFKEGIFRTNSIGTVMLPNELKMENEAAEYYVMTMPAFLYFSKERMSKDDFTDNVLYKLNVIYNYIQLRLKQEKNPRVVIVVEDVADMDKFKDYIVKTEVLLPYLELIYFAGEEYIRVNPNDMLQLYKAGTDHYDYMVQTPDFLA